MNKHCKNRGTHAHVARIDADGIRGHHARSSIAFRRACHRAGLQRSAGIQEFWVLKGTRVRARRQGLG
ncbi:hypothetical protein NL452_26585, partial [Klebsiella pneumoniae]|nr:hypothetical protein [Klebsiella pneumoniae]